MTYYDAKMSLLNLLKTNGYEINEWLKIPWARNKELNIKYYFKTQAIYKCRYCDSLKEAHSLHSDSKSLLANEQELKQFIKG